MQWAVHLRCELLISGDGKEDVAGFDRHLIIAKAVILEDADMVERAFDERFRAGLTIFLEQILLEAAGVDSNADRTAVRARCRNDFADALLLTDVGGIDAQARRTCIRGFESALVVEVDVGNDRHARLTHDLLQRRGHVPGRARYADDVGAGILAAPNLIDRRLGILGRRVGHGLDADRRVSAHGYGADHDLPRLAPLDVTPETDGRHESL